MKNPKSADCPGLFAYIETRKIISNIRSSMCYRIPPLQAAKDINSLTRGQGLP
ncbi:MAG: hypothetical protein V3W45_00375 [Sedimentisphaerales bacterium]